MSLLAMTLALAISMPSHAAGDATRGARAFGQCMACHSVSPDEHLTGPSLARIWQRPAAGAQAFQRYSDALKKSELVWNQATLDKWLTNPEGLVPGTSMTFPGLKDEKQRQDVIAYLHAVSEGKVAQAPIPGMQRQKLDLKAAPPEGQVMGVRYCGDTYTVETADGKSQKIWEFNLRIKSDSSKLGPRPGKPVVIGAGMQGDRASLVFAKPAEISEFIKASCP
jgi:cytochrome c